ncbi:MAG: hypothetical protein DK302_000901 [Chloroflexi bacterium]|jgi:hypothetical protein|nr:MAG: hypothetical protein DK302_000901 [Chloroflexota bacterium]
MIKPSIQHWIINIIDNPLSWSIVGFIAGLLLGANLISMWIMLLALILYLGLLRYHRVANPRTETKLFATGPGFLICWVFGLIVHGWVF